jgi:hypothetical protein
MGWEFVSKPVSEKGTVPFFSADSEKIGTVPDGFGVCEVTSDVCISETKQFSGHRTPGNCVASGKLSIQGMADIGRRLTMD